MKKKIRIWDAVLQKKGKNAERKEIQLPVRTSLTFCVSFIGKNTKKCVNKQKNRNYMNKITETEFKTLVNRFNRSARAEERISELDDKI